MPLPTYHNLKEEKKKRVYQAVFKELTRVPLEEAQIKNIVQEANVPRGSFYQYFSDKEDALRHLIATVRQDDEEMVIKSITEPKPSIFGMVEAVFSHEMVQLKSKGKTPKSQLFLQISKSKRAREILFDEIASTMIKKEAYKLFWENAQLGSLTKEDQNLLMDLAFVSLKEALLNILQDGSTAQQEHMKLRKKLRIIQQGATILL